MAFNIPNVQRACPHRRRVKCASCAGSLAPVAIDSAESRHRLGARCYYRCRGQCGNVREVNVQEVVVLYERREERSEAVARLVCALRAGPSTEVGGKRV